MTEHTATPAAPPSSGFWDWAATRGYVREGGWIGSVCAAAARRAGVDPVVVRGCFVAAALVGFPALWVYAIAWAVLPDAEGRIALRFDQGARTSLAGALVTAGLATVSTVTTLGALAFVGYALGGGALTAMVTLALLLAVAGVVAAFVVWLVRRPSPARRAAGAGARLSVVVPATVGAGLLVMGAVWFVAGGGGTAGMFVVLAALTTGGVVLLVITARTGQRGGAVAAAAFVTVCVVLLALWLFMTTMTALSWSGGPYTGLSFVTVTALILAVAALGTWAAWRKAVQGRSLAQHGYGSPGGYGAGGYPPGGYTRSPLAAPPAVVSPGDPSAHGPAAAPLIPRENADGGAGDHAESAGGIAGGDAGAWRARQDAWREEREAWRRRQADGDQSAREEERARRREEARAFAAESARLRALRRAARPRISLAFGVSVVGIALIAAAVAAIAVMGSDGWESKVARSLAATAAAFFAAGVVPALAMVLAGALRRRSGFLAFLAVTCTTLGALAVGGGVLSGGTVQTAEGGASALIVDAHYGLRPGAGTFELTQLYGTTEVNLVGDEGGSGEVVLRRGRGMTILLVHPDVDVSFTGEISDGYTMVRKIADEHDWTPLGEEEFLVPEPGESTVTWEHDAGEGAAAQRTVEVTQNAGTVLLLEIQGDA